MIKLYEFYKKMKCYLYIRIFITYPRKTNKKNLRKSMTGFFPTIDFYPMKNNYQKIKYQIVDILA